MTEVHASKQLSGTIRLWRYLPLDKLVGRNNRRGDDQVVPCLSAERTPGQIQESGMVPTGAGILSPHARDLGCRASRYSDGRSQFRTAAPVGKITTGSHHLRSLEFTVSRWLLALCHFALRYSTRG